MTGSHRSIVGEPSRSWRLLDKFRHWYFSLEVLAIPFVSHSFDLSQFLIALRVQDCQVAITFDW
jgi:hypothetical protein